MYLSKPFGFLLALFLWTNFLPAQQDTLSFPASWEGEWIGDLVISTTAGETQRLPMILRIFPLDDGRYTYTIVYGEENEENTRPYFLQVVADDPGHYQIDEDNSIVLDEYFINNKLYSRFEVMGSLLLATVEERDEHLIYEIIAGPMEPVNTTGNTTIDGEEIPPVASFRIQVQQRAVLTRQD